MSNIAGLKVPTLFRTLADTNNRSSAQVNAVVAGEKQRPAAGHRQNLSYNVSSTPRLSDNIH
jgi:hypothetical protein